MTKTVFSVVFRLCQHLIYANNIDNLKQVSMLAPLMHFNVTKNTKYPVRIHDKHIHEPNHQWKNNYTGLNVMSFNASENTTLTC